MNADLIAEVEAARATLASCQVDANALAELAPPTTSNTARGLASSLPQIVATLDHVSEHLNREPEVPAQAVKVERPAKPKAKKAKPVVEMKEPEDFVPPGAKREEAKK